MFETGGRRLAFSALFGSHNYNLNTEKSDKDYKVFRTVLRPIADMFLKQLAKSKHISRPYAGFKYTYVERFNTSADLVKQSVQLYGSSVDAIELIQMQLDLLNLEC